jgi:uncharacterized protein (TIGR03000 family)
MKTTSAERTFSTPALVPGYDYYYVARAEVVIAGQTHTETKRIIVRANQTAQVTFSELIALRNGNRVPPAAVAGGQ